MKSILSFDPGGTTGYVFMRYEKESLPKVVEVGQIPDGRDGFISWWRCGGDKMAEESQIICESFTLREGIPGVNLEPCYVIGALEALTVGKKIVYQKPAFKVYCDNDAMKRLGFYIKGQEHARDAIRHAVAYLITAEKHLPTYRTGWPDEDYK